MFLESSSLLIFSFDEHPGEKTTFKSILSVELFFCLSFIPFPSIIYITLPNNQLIHSFTVEIW